jgi:hypothetical protein
VLVVRAQYRSIKCGVWDGGFGGEVGKGFEGVGEVVGGELERARGLESRKKGRVLGRVGES